MAVLKNQRGLSDMEFITSKRSAISEVTGDIWTTDI